MILYPASASAASSSSERHLSHTIFHKISTHHFVTHHLSHTIFHTRLCHTPSFTHNFVTRHLSHTTCAHTIFHQTIFHTHHLSSNRLFPHTHTISHIHTIFVAHNFVTHHLSHSHYLCQPQLCHTPSFHLRFAWQAWHLATSTFVARGRCGTCGTGLDLVARLVAGDAAALCVAGVALGDIHLRFAWHAWRLATSTFVSRGRCGRRGTCGTGLDLGARLGALSRR